jgi:hypothetical protein
MRVSSLIILVMLSAAVGAPGAEWTAPRLAQAMAEAVEDGDAIARIKMTTPETGVLQIRIKSHRGGSKAAVAYEILWPNERKGEGFVLRQSGGGAAQGAFKTASGEVSKLGASELSEPFFATALAYADAIENFFRWKNQSLSATEAVGKTDCIVLESKTGAGETSIYSKVRSWIDPDRMVTMRVEKYDKAGQLARRIETTQVAKDDRGRHVPAGMSVKAGAKVTEIDGVNVRHDVTHSDADFGF